MNKPPGVNLGNYLTTQAIWWQHFKLNGNCPQTHPHTDIHTYIQTHRHYTEKISRSARAGATNKK